MSRRRLHTRTPLAELQGLRNGRVPEHLDVLVADGDRDRTEVEFTSALRHGLNEAFGGQGMHCAAIVEAIGNNGYRLLMKDREQRDVWGYLSFQEMIDHGETHGADGIFDFALGKAVASIRKSLAERAGEPENLVEAAVREHARDQATTLKTFGRDWKDKDDGSA